MTRQAFVPMLALAIAAVLNTACARSIEPTEALEPVEVKTGWFDAGIENGKNKLVPSVSLKLRNKSTIPIRSVQINAIFRRVGEEEMWGEHFSWAIQREPLQPGGLTEAVVLRSALGYTGEQPRLQLLQHTQFIDAKVDLFLKQGSRTWSKLIEYQVDRTLLTR